MKGVLSIVCIMLLLPAIGITQQNKRPNFILILADDLGYGETGCYGQQKIETPHIDKLAAGGIKFTQFYAGTSVCAPSRASLLTGLHTGHTAIRGNKGTEPEGQTPLPDSVTTIATLLQQHGYTTAAFGKWGLGYITTSGDPNKKGFDQFYGYNCQTLAHDYYPDHLWKNKERIDLSVNLMADSIYSADLIQKEALHFLNEKHDQPFFAYLPYTLPHGDVIVPHDSLYEYYKKKFNESPLTGDALKTMSHNMKAEPYPHAAFAAMVGRLDKYVGEIIETLKQNGTLDNTLIIFTSDNGPHKENGGDPEFFNSNGDFRGIKRDLYEGGIRVPFIAYWKGKIKPGVSDHIAAGWDIYPTLQQLAGMKITRGIDGISLLPVLLNKGKQEPHNYLYWEFHENNGRQALRWGKWKAVRLNVTSDPNSPIELYDLNKDPGEQNNIATQYPLVVKQIEQMIKQSHVRNIDWPLLPAEK
ncbi:MAG TPA: arylsulfatase [Chitinophagaceae bacterium]